MLMMNWMAQDLYYAIQFRLRKVSLEICALVEAPSWAWPRVLHTSLRLDFNLFFIPFPTKLERILDNMTLLPNYVLLCIH